LVINRSIQLGTRVQKKTNTKNLQTNRSHSTSTKKFVFFYIHTFSHSFSHPSEHKPLEEPKSKLTSHHFTQLLAPLNRSPNSPIDHLLQTSRLEALNRSVGGAVRARDVAAQLLGLLGRRDEHAAGAQAGLGGEARGLLERQALRHGARDQILD
jgi:hypothetical protein